MVRGSRITMKSGPRSPQLERALAQKQGSNTDINKKIKKKKQNSINNFFKKLKKKKHSSECVYQFLNIQRIRVSLRSSLKISKKSLTCTHGPRLPM